jgi:intraflagellar transport protein 140
MNEAVLLIEATNNLAASYHVARYCEEHGKISEAVQYYSKAKCYGNAIQVCKEHKMDQELMGLGLQGSRDCMIDVAK